MWLHRSDGPYGYTLAGNETTNMAITSMPVPVLECPSHPSAGEVSTTPAGNTGTSTGFYDRVNARRTSYLFCVGYHTDYDNPYGFYKNTLGNTVRLGAFGNSGAARLRDLTDGTSNVALVGEAWGGAQYKTSTNYGPWGLKGIHTCCHGRVISTTAVTNPAAFTPYAAQWHINADYAGNGTHKQYAWGFGSGHTGGAQFLFGDGSVRFLSQNMLYQTFVLLNYIRDAQVVGEF